MQEVTLLAVLCTVGVVWGSNDVNSVCSTVNPSLNTSLPQLSGRWVALERLLMVDDDEDSVENATQECVTASAHGSRSKLSIITDEHVPGLEPTTSILTVTSEDLDDTVQNSNEVKVLAADHTKYFVLLRCDAPEDDPDVSSSVTLFVRRRLIAGHRVGWRKRKRQRRRKNKGKWWRGVQDYSDYTECEPAEVESSDEDHEVVVDESNEEESKPYTIKRIRRQSKASKHDGFESDDEEDDLEGSGEQKTHGKVRYNKKYRKRQYKPEDSEEEDKSITKHTRGKWRQRGHKHDVDGHESNEHGHEDDSLVIENFERKQNKRKWRQKERQRRRKLRKESEIEPEESHEVTDDMKSEIESDDALIEVSEDDDEVTDVEVDTEGSGDVTTDDEDDVTSSGDDADGHQHRVRRKKLRKRKNRKNKFSKHRYQSLAEEEILEIRAEVAQILGKSKLLAQALDTSCLSYKKNFKKKGKKFYRKRKYHD